MNKLLFFYSDANTLLHATHPCKFMQRVNHLSVNCFKLKSRNVEISLDSKEYQELIRAHEEERFDDISYCKNCDQLWEVPESLVWTNIDNRKYNTSKVIEDMKLA